MKIYRYIIFYSLLACLCVSQIVTVLSKTGQNVHASEQLNYLQKQKLQLQADINLNIAKQAKSAAITKLLQSAEVTSSYLPINTVLAIQIKDSRTLSFNSQIR